MKKKIMMVFVLVGLLISLGSNYASTNVVADGKDITTCPTPPPRP